jgi:hypothetical protein
MSLSYRQLSAVRAYGTFIINCVLQKMTLAEEGKLNEFSNRMVRRTYGHQRDEVTGERR